MKSILEVSKRTTSKIIKRLNIVCSNCGWNEAHGDIHHIHHKAKGGSDDHSNLSYLCPNCHRLAHVGKLIKFVTLEEQIGDRWKEAYEEPSQKARDAWAKSIKQNREKRLSSIRKTYPERIQRLKDLDVDFSKRGWSTKASEALGISPQHIIRWVKKNCPELIMGGKS